MERFIPAVAIVLLIGLLPVVVRIGVNIATGQGLKRLGGQQQDGEPEVQARTFQ